MNNKTDNLTKDSYNGYANYETWNVALWLLNDETIYNNIVTWVQTWVNESNSKATYKKFIATTKLLYLANGEGGGFTETPDGVSWTDSKLNHEELDAIIQEIKDES